MDTPNYIEFQVEGSAFLGLMDSSLSQSFVGERKISLEPGLVRPVEIYLRTSDPTACIAKLSEAGAELTSPLKRRAWGEEAAYMLDPEGNILAIASQIIEDRIE